MNKNLTLALWLAAISVSSFASIAQESKKPDLTTHLRLPHSQTTLANGLNIILSEDHSTPFVAVSIWYKVGSVHEKLGRTGFAHLFEHQMFGGTRHVKNGDHFRLLELAGAIDLNATTNFDRTNYYQTMPANQLELALALESSRMTWLAIDQKRLDEQRAVVRREREQRIEAKPYGMANLKLWEKTFPPHHPFHSYIIGSHKDIEAATLTDVKEFYDKYYGPSNASLALVGAFKMDEALTLINKYFATLPKTPSLPKVSLPPLSIKGEEILREEEKMGKLSLVRMHYLTPALYKSGDAELDIIGHILARGQSGRLVKALTRDAQLALSVSAYQQSYDQISIFVIEAMVNPGVDEALIVQKIDKVLDDLQKQSITQAEIDQARNAILTQQLFGLENLGGSFGRAELLQSYNHYTQKPDYLKEDFLRYQVDAQALTKAAQSYLPPGTNRKILIAKPNSVAVAHKGN